MESAPLCNSSTHLIFAPLQACLLGAEYGNYVYKECSTKTPHDQEFRINWYPLKKMHCNCNRLANRCLPSDQPTLGHWRATEESIADGKCQVTYSVIFRWQSVGMSLTLQPVRLTWLPSQELTYNQK